MSAFLGYLPLIWLDIIPETWSCCYLEKIRTHGRIGLDLRLQNNICSYSCCCRNVCLWARLTIICSPAAWVSTLSFPVSVLGLRVHACGFNWNLNFPLLKSALPSISSLKKQKQKPKEMKLFFRFPTFSAVRCNILFLTCCFYLYVHI